jgi:hypothetical protein
MMTPIWDIDRTCRAHIMGSGGVSVEMELGRSESSYRWCLYRLQITH